MPGDRVRVAVSSAVDEGACTNPDQMAGTDQRGHPVTAVTALGQVTSERDTVETDEAKPQEFVHALSVASVRSADRRRPQPVDDGVTRVVPVDSTFRSPHGIPRSPMGSGGRGGFSWHGSDHPRSAVSGEHKLNRYRPQRTRMAGIQQVAMALVALAGIVGLVLVLWQVVGVFAALEGVLPDVDAGPHR